MSASIRTSEACVIVDAVSLTGTLAMPRACRGLVLFAHGERGNRRSYRNRLVAEALAEAGFGTLLFDLLSPREALDPGSAADLALLCRRMRGATEWLRRHEAGSDLPIGYFGAGTGTAAALCAAARIGDAVAAVVSRGGHPDLVADALPKVRAPTLLIVGSRDRTGLVRNRRARRCFTCACELHVISKASRLFDEPGALDAVAAKARAWYEDRFAEWERTRARPASGTGETPRDQGAIENSITFG